MRDIRDFRSPYYDSYTEFDYWCYTHAQTAAGDIFDGGPAGAAGVASVTVMVSVDADGYQVPQLAALCAETRANGQGCPPAKSGCEGRYCAHGALPAELAEYYFCTQAQALAPLLEQVPGWLAEAQPLAAVLLPEGDVAVLGQAGEGVGQFEIAWSRLHDAADWSRYSAAGELVRTGVRGEPWQALFGLDYAGLLAQAAAAQATVRDDGPYLVVCRTAGAREASAYKAYDYHGNPVELAPNELFTKPAAYEPVPGGLLPLVHEAQQRQQAERDY